MRVSQTVKRADADLDLQRAWIVSFLQRETEVSAVHAEFHAAFATRFDLPTQPSVVGASVCRTAMRRLAHLASTGVLTRQRTPLGTGWQPGFPRWVYSYSLRRDVEDGA